MADVTLQRELWVAIANGDLARVQEVAEKGADVNASALSSAGETPLIRAVTAGNMDLVRLLISLGVDINLPCQGPKSWTPLMFAHDNPDMIRELVVAGADVNARTTAGWIKAASGRLIQRPGGETALHLAAAEGNATAVRALLKAGAEVEAPADDGRTPLDYAIRLGVVTEAAEALVEAGAQLTPQRLEIMHSSAHNPESDLIMFPSTAEGGNGLPGRQAVGGTQHEKQPSPPPAERAGAAPVEFRCPNCHSLIYSRKPKICGQCGMLLPAELLLNDVQAQAVTDERRWARALAAKFDGQRSATAPASVHTAIEDGLAQTISPEDLLRRVSCAEEFGHRDRPTFWLYLVGYGFSFFVLTYIPFQLGVMPPAGLLLIGGMFAFLCLRAWYYASPVCPNCHQNIRLCTPVFCHVCGQSLKYKRCQGCGVDHAWTGFLRPYSGTGNFRWITYCPGCGGQLDSKVVRWRSAD